VVASLTHRRRWGHSASIGKNREREKRLGVKNGQPSVSEGDSGSKKYKWGEEGKMAYSRNCAEKYASSLRACPAGAREGSKAEH